MLPSRYNSIIKEKIQLSPKVTKVTLKLVDPPIINFTAGQFVNIRIKENVFRSYSICSDPKVTSELDLLIATGHKGEGSDFINNSNIGDEVNFIGPSGRFSLLQPLPNKINFLATGTGIAPFISMFYELKDLAYEGEVNLYVGFRYENEVFYEDVFKKFESELKGFKYNIYVSQPEEGFKGNTGRLDVVYSLLNDKSAQYYVCGHPDMIMGFVDYAKGVGLNESHVFFESFLRK